MDFDEAVLFHEFFFFLEDTLTHSCRSLAENKIEQLPPGIFSDLSELRYFKFFSLFVPNVQDYNTTLVQPHIHTIPYQ